MSDIALYAKIGKADCECHKDQYFLGIFAVLKGQEQEQFCGGEYFKTEQEAKDNSDRKIKEITEAIKDVLAKDGSEMELVSTSTDQKKIESTINRIKGDLENRTDLN